MTTTNKRNPMDELADAIDRSAHAIATETLKDCTPNSHHEAIVAGFKAGASYILALMRRLRQNDGGRN